MEVSTTIFIQYLRIIYHNIYNQVKAKANIFFQIEEKKKSGKRMYSKRSRQGKYLHVSRSFRQLNSFVPCPYQKKKKEQCIKKQKQNQYVTTQDELTMTQHTIKPWNLLPPDFYSNKQIRRIRYGKHCLYIKHFNAQDL